MPNHLTLTLLAGCLVAAPAAAIESAAPAAAIEPAAPAAATDPVAPDAPAAAVEPAQSPDPAALARPAFRPGLVPALAAIVPGVLLHGSGHYVAGDEDTALTLLATQGIGVGMIVVGGGALAATGASRRIIGVTSAVALSGVGLLTTPMLADLYGAITGGRDAPPAALVPLTARLGYAWIHDPQFDYGHFTTLGLDARFEHLTLASSAWIAVDDDNQRLRQRLDWRWLGDNRGVIDDGSALDLVSAVTWHRYGTDGFQVLSGEVSFDGRYDLQRLSPTLAGSFAIATLGWGLELYDYDVPGLSLGEDTAEMLLLRFGWGLYFADRRGELAVFYDHRKDDYAGGLGVTGLGAGVPGHLGLSADYAIDETWGVDLEVEVGAAYIVGLGLRYRYGGDR